MPMPPCPCRCACAEDIEPKHRARATVPGPSCLCPSHSASDCVFLLECQIQNAQFQCTARNYLAVTHKSTERKSTSEDRWLFDPSVCAFPVPPLDKPSMATQSHRKVQETDCALWHLGTWCRGSHHSQPDHDTLFDRWRCPHRIGVAHLR